MTRVRPAAWSSNTSRRSARVPTIDPTIVIPLRTVSKIGISTEFSAGRATNTKVPPTFQQPVRLAERLWRDRERDRGVSSSKSLDCCRRILRQGVHCEVGAQLASELELVVVEVDCNDPCARYPGGTPNSEVTEAADAEDRNQVAGARARNL